MKKLLILFAFIRITYGDSVYVNNFGITHHDNMSSEAKLYLDHPLSSDGKTVLHSDELGVLYKNTKSHIQIYGLYLRDCFNNNSGYIAAGPFTRYGIFDIGLLIGPYMSETTPFYIVYNNITPMPLFTTGINVLFWDNLGFAINAGTNYFITHATAGLYVEF